MRNIIRNSCWRMNANGDPNYFMSSGVRFNACLDHFRVGSVRQWGGESYIAYEPLIPVCECDEIVWGIIIRSGYADEIVLRAEFLDCDGNVLEVDDRDITCQVSSQFCRVEDCFVAPCFATHVRLSIHFYGRVERAEFYAPCAHFNNRGNYCR